MGSQGNTFIKPSLEEAFHNAWENGRVIFFSAPCGCGKTTVAAKLLRGRNYCTFSAENSEFSPECIPPGCEAVLTDDMQYLTDPERQQSLYTLIHTHRDLRFILLGRCAVPGWLIAFQLAGVMQVFTTEDLLLDRMTARRMLESHGIVPDMVKMGEIQHDLNGYPVALELLCTVASDGRPYSPEVLAELKQKLFFYYDDAVFQRFEPSLRALLLSLAPFESFHLELARMVSGESRAGELLGTIQRDTSMLQFDGADTYRFWNIMREYLFWKYERTKTPNDRKNICRRAALYYELHGELEKALDFYTLAGEQERVSALLVKNAGLHPGVGHYREMQNYYFALPRKEILRSPVLICGMSMLSAMTLDYEGSEEWYRELEKYASNLKKVDTEYRDVRGRLAYLDIALPQRGSRNLIQVIDKVFRVMQDKQLHIPAFSVTSTLPSIMNGGKDFCEWSKKDDLLYATMRRPVEAVLGKDGIGLADCAVCESKFEKGENVSERMLTLMTRLGEIQARGTPDIEFAVIGLLARIQVSQGKAAVALESIESLREKYVQTGETRFLGNIDAMLVRIRLCLGSEDAVRAWLDKEAPRNDARLWCMWRYQYETRVLAQLSVGEAQEPLLILARLTPYCETCGRIMDGLHIHILSALCRERMGSEIWKDELCTALETSLEYKFIWPIAQYGAAVLPLLRRCGWKKNEAFLRKVTEAARTQAVFYPKYLKPGAHLVSPLSATEMQVLRLLSQDLGNQEIGAILGIKLATVKSHVSHIFQKLDVQNRSEAKSAAAALHLL